MNIDIKGNEKFTVFYFIKNKNYPIKVKREDFNSLDVKVFSNHSLNVLKNSLTKIQNSYNVKVKDYSIGTNNFLYDNVVDDKNTLYLVQIILMILTYPQNEIFTINEFMDYIKLYSI